MMTYLDVLAQLKKNELQPVYVLYGTEDYFIQNIKSEIEKRLASQTEGEHSTYDLEEIPIEEVVTDVETYPFFSEHKLIFAYNPQFLSASPAKLPFEHNVNALERYLENPVHYTTLILIAPYEKLDQRKKITKHLNKFAVVAECNQIKEHELGKWIQIIAEDLQITVESAAFEVFEAALSTNLYLLQSELQKLALYVGENGVVTKKVAEELVSSSTTSSSLRLVDAVIAGDLHKAIHIFKDLEKMKEEPIALIGLLAFQFRTILRVKLLKAKGYTEQRLQKQIGVHPYVIKIASSREKQFTAERLEAIIQRLANTDALMKQGEMDKTLAFELLLYELVKK